MYIEGHIHTSLYTWALTAWGKPSIQNCTWLRHSQQAPVTLLWVRSESEDWGVCICTDLGGNTGDKREGWMTDSETGQ